MRPRSEVRLAMVGAFHDLARAQRAELGQAVGVTWRDAARHAQVGFDVARKCAENMATAGELQRNGTVRTEHACRPMVRYLPADTGSGALDALGSAMQGWATFD
jgi:hypothetical protein